MDIKLDKGAAILGADVKQCKCGYTVVSRVLPSRCPQCLKTFPKGLQKEPLSTEEIINKINALNLGGAVRTYDIDAVRWALNTNEPGKCGGVFLRRTLNTGIASSVLAYIEVSFTDFKDYIYSDYLTNLPAPVLIARAKEGYLKIYFE